MNNNYEYVEKLKENKEEQKKIEEQLQKELDILLISEEEKEKLLLSVIKSAIDSYTPTTLFPFLRYVKIKLKKEIEKKYFTPSQIISVEEQKIINLYLSKKEEQFLTEEEIRKRLQINSGTLYQAIFKLENGTAKTRKELLTLFPNYKEQIKERKSFFKQSVKTSEDSLRYLGYYIGEVDDICLDIHEIALKEGKKEEEIEKELKEVFKSLKEETALQLVLKKYPNSEKMLQIKAKNFGIKLQTKEKDKTEESKISEAKQTLPEEPRKTEKQEKTIPEKERKRKHPQKTSHEKPLLTEKQETLLKELAKNPNIPKKELAKILGYKNTNSIWTMLASLKNKCKTNEELKEKILKLYPDFLTPKPKVEKKNKQKKEKTLLTEKQETLLKELAKNPNISKKELAKILGYTNIKGLYSALEHLKKACEQSEKVKEKVLELYPDFLKPKEKSLLTEKQENLLQVLAKNPNISKKELAETLGYKNTSGLYSAIEDLKNKCTQNKKAKEKVLELYPDFLKPKEKSLLSKKQETLLKELAKNPNIDKKTLAKIAGYKNAASVWSILPKLKKDCKTNEKLKARVLEIYPEFLTTTPEKKMKEKTLLTEKQETLLKELAKNPNISKKELAKILEYKNTNGLRSLLERLKKKCAQNEKLKEEILKLYPDFLKPKEKSLLTEKERILLQELAKNPNIDKKTLAKIAGYKSDDSIRTSLSKLKKECKTNEKLKEKILKLYPDFLKPKEKPLLSKKQETLLQKLAKNPTIAIDELVEITGYKNRTCLQNTLNKLKKACAQNEKLKAKVLEIYPELLTTNLEKKEKPLLTKKQEILLQVLAKNPNISKKELAETLGYKNTSGLSSLLERLKNKCAQNEKVKEKVLELYPDFLKPKEKSLLTKKQETLLKELAKNPNIDKKTLAKIAGYKNAANIWSILLKLKKECRKNEKLKARVLEIYPEFLTTNPEKKKEEKKSLTEKEKILLQELAKNPNTSKKELAKILGYKNTNSFYSALDRLKKKCAQNEKIKEKILELYPDFLKLKEKTLLTEKQKTLLQELAKNPNISKKELAETLGYKNTSGLSSLLERLKKECKQNEKIKEKVLELYPNFLNSKENTLLAKRQETLLQALAQNPTITIEELLKITGYKNQISLQNTLNKLKRACIQDKMLKARALELYPELLTKKLKKKKKEKTSLTEKQEILLQALAQNPNIDKKTLAKIAGYKNANSLNSALERLKKEYKQNEKLKEEILKLYPDFLKPKEKPLLTKKREILLQALAQNPTITTEKLLEMTGYKNQASLQNTLNKLRKDCAQDEKLKARALELYPEFLTPKQKLEKKKKEKKEKTSLTKKQEILLQELAKNPTITIDELVEITGYKNQSTLRATLNKLKRSCAQDEKLKARVLELYPEFLKPKPKKDQVLTNRELEILQNIYLIVPPNTSYATYKQLAKKLHFSEQNILAIKKQALKKIQASSEIQKQLEESWPTFDQDKVIKEQYKKVRSIKIPSEEVEGIKTFIRQFDIPENEITEQENPILTGIKNLEESIFSSYVSKCTEEQKAMLALRLGYINVPARTETVAELFNVEEQEVITLTKNCLKSVKIPTDTKRTAKVYEKKN